MNNTPAYEKEITNDLPTGLPSRYTAGGKTLFVAYGCALLERRTPKSYIYYIVNLENGKSETLLRKRSPLDVAKYNRMVARIRSSSVRGRGRYEVDVKSNERLKQPELVEILTYVFSSVLPRYGYVLRENQIGLAQHILEALRCRAISLAESEVGTGKTVAYLSAAILAKRGRMNDFWLRGHYPGQSYAESVHMPIVITTSSIALQRAIANDYIPEISDILLENDIIRKPISCVIRKGKQHYLCENRLRQVYSDLRDEEKTQLQPLLEDGAPCDLAEHEGLMPYMKRKICVTGRCRESCPYIVKCRYLRFLSAANDSRVDFQITNHNYFLADILHRVEGKLPLIPHYQLVITDEAHKFLQAARQMYGLELSNTEIPLIIKRIHSFSSAESENGATIKKHTKKLGGQNKRLFRSLLESVSQTDNDETERFPALLDHGARCNLKSIKGIAMDIAEAVASEPVSQRHMNRKEQTLWELGQTKDKAASLQNNTDLISWVEHYGDNDCGETKLCAIPKDVDSRLHLDIWSAGIPIILTSGTLSANGNFQRVKQSLGISRIDGNRQMETKESSPFDYRNNALIFLSESVPFPDNTDMKYLAAVADEVERLIWASHGHAAILFTSYNVMGRVYAMLKERNVPFPLFQMDRHDVVALEKYKASGKGVLFAAGALWEGIDVPGDTLSMLVIVKLPFAIPDPIGEYEKSLYGSVEEYKSKVLVPDMLVKLKQGFGRLIRTEKDTGVCAILDSRANERGAYHRHVLSVLPTCRVTKHISDIGQFMKEKKAADYFD